MSPRIAPGRRHPQRDRALHARYVVQQVDTAVRSALTTLQLRDPSWVTGEPGFYLEFRLPAGSESVVEKLENRPKRIELVAVRSDPEEGIRATVFVPVSKSDHFLRKAQAYRDQETPTGKPKNEALISWIEEVAVASARSIFTDLIRDFPDSGAAAWWELWLRKGKLDQFVSIAQNLDVRVEASPVRFPEREVILVLANPETVGAILLNSDSIAEIRLARDTPALFVELSNTEQQEWVRDLLDRLENPSEDAVAVSILDSGVTRSHPLIEPGLAAGDLHAYNPSWGFEDSAYWGGHGTGMAGLVLYGDLTPLLPGNDKVAMRTRIESVKILPPAGQNDPLLYGAITTDAVAQPEITAPQRRRVICMAVTSVTGSDRGRPSSWSASIDQLAYGDGEDQRIFILAAGNVRDDIKADEYPNRNDLEAIENPGQAWNALTVGAFTERVNLTDASRQGWTPVAPAGELSPSSRTAVTWARQWPIKPDIVCEGGNLASDGAGTVDAAEDLQLLTTHYQPAVAHFRCFGETSAATALVSRIAALITATYPRYWPETVRGLVVHSANWTAPMRSRLAQATTETQKIAFLSRYGHGVPDLARGMYSVANDFSLVVQDSITPFHKQGGQIKTKDLNFHQFPWPKDELNRLDDVDVEVRVTLSYFVDPNPGERGWGKRHRYASHGLRFDLKRSLETEDEFRQRINRAVWENETRPNVRSEFTSEPWVLGRIRDRGSIHSDIWRGSAAAFAQRDAIAVFPVGGWWKEKLQLSRYDREARYSLIVSVSAPEADLDIYSLVAVQIQQTIEIET